MNLTRRIVLVAGLASAGLLTAVPAQADLDAYFAKPEPAYRWEKRGEIVRDGCKIYDLHLVSQTWQGITWTHRLQLIYPDKPKYPHFCAIYNTGGGGSEGNTRMGIGLATASSTPYAIVYGIPNQPLYGGLTEDALVVHTWLKYMETGDESWPLHFPMAKAVLKSMDALQDLARKENLPSLDGFMVHGGSKRGWTTWLAAASLDPRIKSIVPMVIDVLNVKKQTEHQLKSYGKFSEQIEDYTRVNIDERLKTPEGKRLMELEDPWSYRKRLTLPKLLILGTNDRYWSQDALNIYWDDLIGPKWVLYAPNSGHGLDDRPRVYAALAAFIRVSAGGSAWPKLSWWYKGASPSTQLTLESDLPIRSARLWYVNAPTRDFRDQKWQSTPMHQVDGASATYRLHWPAPENGFTAVFGEADYEIDGVKFTLSSQIRILEARSKKP